MRTNRERLAEWVVDIMAEYADRDDDYDQFVADHMDEARTWADSIMDDVNNGIIAPDGDK